MPPAIIDVKTTEDARDVVHRAVQALAEGEVVAFPTETVYGLAVSALNENAVERLVEVKGRDSTQPFSLAIKSSDDALDYVPNMSLLGQRLARRCWPGPVTLVLDHDHPDSVVCRLPGKVLERTVRNATLGLRVPAHELILATMRLTAGPLVLTSANLGGQPDATTASEVIDSLGDQVGLVIDDGPCKFAQPSTVLRVQGNQWEILREGVLDRRAIQQLSSFQVLVVCTGNTCRSPMAEILLKKRLAERFQCSLDQLEEHGVMVSSAGIAAIPGGRPSPEAVGVVADRKLDLSAHSSQPVTPRLVRNADVILTMTRGHRQAIINEWPEAAHRTHVLSRNGDDIADPIGGPPALYSQCADQIDSHLAEWAEKFQIFFENESP